MRSPSEFKALLVAVLFLLILVGILVPNEKSAAALELLPLALMDRSRGMFAPIALFLVRMSNTAIPGPDPQLATSAWITFLAAHTRSWNDFVFIGNTDAAPNLSVVLIWVGSACTLEFDS